MIIYIRCLLTNSLVEFNVSQNDSIKSLKRRILNDYFFRIDQQRLIYQAIVLEDVDTFQEIEDHGMIYLDIVVPPLPLGKNHSFEPYIKSFTAISRRGSVDSQCKRDNVQINSFFEVKFQPNLSGEYLSLELFKSNTGNLSKSGDMIEICGAVGAKQRGFTHWTYHTLTSKLVLLEVHDKASNIESIQELRYNWKGINAGYYGGDIHSWQRYTKKLPILCKVDVDPKKNLVTVIPSQRLQSETQYAILLCNGVLVNDPKDGGRSSTGNHSIVSHGIQEDHLFFFRTATSVTDVDVEESIELSTNPITKKVIDGDKSLPQIHVRSNNKTLTVHQSLDSTIETLNQLLRDVEGHPVRSQQLLYQGKLLDPKRTFRSYDIIEGRLLHAIYSKRPLPSSADIYYSEYIRQVYPNHLEENIALNVTIRIEFGSNSNGRQLHLPSFADITDTKTCIHDMVEIHGSVTAAQRGFVRWTTYTSNQRLYLLEINPEIVEKLDSIRYYWAPWSKLNGYYYGGDEHSWQRYTNKLPIKGKITIKNDASKVFFSLTDTLSPHTLYGILLANGVPTSTTKRATPTKAKNNNQSNDSTTTGVNPNSTTNTSSSLDSIDDDSTIWGMFEDKLFLFETGDMITEEIITIPNNSNPASPDTNKDTTSTTGGAIINQEENLDNKSSKGSETKVDLSKQLIMKLKSKNSNKSLFGNKSLSNPETLKNSSSIELTTSTSSDNNNISTNSAMEVSVDDSTSTTPSTPIRNINKKRIKPVHSPSLMQFAAPANPPTTTEVIDTAPSASSTPVRITGIEEGPNVKRSSSRKKKIVVEKSPSVSSDSSSSDSDDPLQGQNCLIV